MHRWPAILVLALASAGVRAEPASPLPPVEQRSLDDFAAADPGCREWSDGCVVCMRRDGADKDAFACSTPGIACTPTTLVCRAPASPAPATKP